MDFRITDGERERYTAIYGKDPLARDGWLVLRLRRGLGLLGCELPEAFDLLAAPDEEMIQTPGFRGPSSMVVEIRSERVADARTFRVRIP